MSTSQRKARKKAGVKIERESKEGTDLIRRRLFLAKSWPAQKRELDARRLAADTKAQTQILANRRKLKKGEL